MQLSPIPENLPSLGVFASDVLKQPLYPYQEQIGEAILDSILYQRGHTFTVMMARQMGKNQLSAVLEAYLLTQLPAGSIVKAAPTFQPQIITSRLRLLQMLQQPELSPRVWSSFGHIIGLAPTKAKEGEQRGPRLFLLSAGPDSNIVGATASLLLEVDEAQEVSPDKFNIELKPMAATTQATTVLYGTAWTETTLLAMQRAHNLELERQDGIQRHFEFDWTHLAQHNPRYRNFVEAEIARLGEEHISIRTQYRLLPISGAGLLLNDLQQHLLRGAHSWQAQPEEDADGNESYYVAGIDVGGEERANPNPAIQGAQGKRDSTVVTIGRVVVKEFGLPMLEIVHQQWWTGKPYMEQYQHICALAEQFHLRRIVIDRTGLGDMLASLLETRLGTDRVAPYHFSSASKSSLTYHLLGLINSARLKLPRYESSPQHIADECWQQLRSARYSIPGEGLMNMYVDPVEGHDDFLISLALCSHALSDPLPIAICPSIIARPDGIAEGMNVAKRIRSMFWPGQRYQ